MCLVRTALAAAALMAVLVGIVNADTTMTEPAVAPAEAVPSANLDRILSDVVPLSGIIAVFGTIVLLTAIPLMLGYRKEVLRHRTMREMVDQHQPIPPQLLSSNRLPRSDLRRGITLIATGLGLALFFTLFSGLASFSGLWAVGLIPGLIGVGHLVVWKLERKSGNGDV